MSYKIKIDKPARKFIAKQPEQQQQRILRAIAGLPFAGDIKPLKGYGDGVFRLRVGNYRIIYSVWEDTLTVLIMNAGNRGDIYK
jgi:mRNA interferase RelE/StbE